MASDLHWIEDPKLERGVTCFRGYWDKDGALVVGASRVPPELSLLLEELAEKLIPESRKRELKATRRCIQEAGEAKVVVWLAERNQSTLCNLPYAVPGPRR